MSCEICKIIERKGLDPSAHDWWFCSDAAQRRGCRTAFILRRTSRHFRARWLRSMALGRRHDKTSAPLALSRELKFLSYSLATQLGAYLR
jgi:hypothetical protein